VWYKITILLAEYSSFPTHSISNLNYYQACFSTKKELANGCLTSALSYGFLDEKPRKAAEKKSVTSFVVQSFY
jgi:hypothetical protein